MDHLHSPDKKKPDCYTVRFISVEITSRILYGIRVFSVYENLKVNKECVVNVVYYAVNKVLFGVSIFRVGYLAILCTVNCSFMCSALYNIYMYIYLYVCIMYICV